MRLKLMLFTLFVGLALFSAGCTDSNLTTNHSNMDHSQMGHSMTNSTDDSTPISEETTVVNGKSFSITAMPSQLKVTDDKTLQAWTFNNSVPGPEIRVKQGDKISITLNNQLPNPVTIHWHGVPVPNEMDGIPGVTQNAVQPGDSFVYEFVADVPGTYWYHSHQDSVNQVDRGLYGAFIVERSDDKVDRDYTLILDEWMSMDMGNMDMGDMDGMEGMDDGSGHDGHGGDNNPHGTPSEGHDMSMYDLFTLNGKSGDSIKDLVVREGEKVRIRLINAGFMKHSLHLHGHEYRVTAIDGQPINQPSVISNQLIEIAPGERYDLEFEANNPGAWYLEAHGEGSAVKGMRAIIRYEDYNGKPDSAAPTAKLPVLDITRYGEASASKFTLDREYDLEYTMNLGTELHNGAQVFTINGKIYPDTETIRVKTGDLIKVRFVNSSETDDHPMHLHGHFFQVLSKNGKPLKGSPLLKDTLNVKPGEEYIVAFEADNPGDWMFHCHDLHHASAGMVTHMKYAGFKSTFVPDDNAGNKPE